MEFRASLAPESNSRSPVLGSGMGRKRPSFRPSRSEIAANRRTTPMFTNGRRTAAGLPPLVACRGVRRRRDGRRNPVPQPADERPLCRTNGPAGRWRQACASVRETPPPPSARRNNRSRRRYRGGRRRIPGPFRRAPASGRAKESNSRAAPRHSRERACEEIEKPYKHSSFPRKRE